MNKKQQITRPMLAGKVENFGLLRYPLLATPKLDGIRCLKIAGCAVSRSLKSIQNNFIRDYVEAHFPDGVDGELIVPGAPFCDVASAVGKRDGEPDFRYHIFDYVRGDLNQTYTIRMTDLRELPNDKRLVKVLPALIADERVLREYEETCIALGYEGTMVRAPMSPYKCGRSTERDGYLLKIKRFEDGEAVICGFTEKEINDNAAEENELGLTSRSSRKSGKRPGGTLGALLVRDVVTGAQFSVSGFDKATAQSIWNDRRSASGRVIKYKHQPSGAKDLPRFPKFIAFREKWDL